MVTWGMKYSPPGLPRSHQVVGIQPLKLRQHEQPILPYQHPIEPDLPAAPLRGLDEDQVPVDSGAIPVVAEVLVGPPGVKWRPVQPDVEDQRRDELPDVT